MKTSQPHYLILDALRGVAAVAVLCYHLFEGIAFSAQNPIQDMYHGFLAVDFFFILSGFVMGYAYDRRWDRMSKTDFIRRRLIRLHPMVVIGVLWGAVLFCMQGCERWDGTQTSGTVVLLSTLMALFLLPVSSSLDVRGNTEAFPLNGVHWSLFFEYVGSVMYALLLRKLSTRMLAGWVMVAFMALAAHGWFYADGSVATGWSSEPLNFLGGMLRMSYAYPLGLLLSRLYAKRAPRSFRSVWVFPLSAVALLCVLVVPYMGVYGFAYQLVCLSVFFPILIWTAACGVVSGTAAWVSDWLGRLSYPLYATHFPLIYLYIGWLNDGVHPFGSQPWCTPVAIFVLSLLLAFVTLKWYDEPLRRRLSRRQ